MKIGIIGKRDSKEVYEITKKLTAWLKEKGIEFYVNREIAKNIKEKNSLLQRNIPKKVDIVVVFGGDGTFLSVAHESYKYNKPLLGFNLGGLGSDRIYYQ